MLQLQVAKVVLSVKVVVPITLLQNHLPAPIDKLGGQLAEQVDKRAGLEQLGYYPALDYFKGLDGFPVYLLDAVNEVSLLAVSITSEKINELLIPIFSNVQIRNIQCLAFSLPAARPGKAGALQALARHFTPNVIKFELVVSVLRKQKSQEGFEKYADNTVYRWLSEAFDHVEIISARLL